ncbi:MAG: flagellar type III secretion system pore protein FliP [Myxococcota bacterium]
MDEPLSWVFVLAGLGLLPFALMLTTSFCKYVVVLSLLRSALGSPQVPPSVVITALAGSLTALTMAPTLNAAWSGAEPELRRFFEGRDSARRWDAAHAGLNAAWAPFESFLRRHTDPEDLALLASNAPRPSPLLLIPAFLVSELSAAFRIAFVIFLPFLAVDLVVANVLMALGMQMMAPTTVSLPLKLLLFSAIDGWRVLAQGLLGSYA